MKTLLLRTFASKLSYCWLGQRCDWGCRRWGWPAGSRRFQAVYKLPTILKKHFSTGLKIPTILRQGWYTNLWRKYNKVSGYDCNVKHWQMLNIYKSLINWTLKTNWTSGNPEAKILSSDDTPTKASAVIYSRSFNRDFRQDIKFRQNLFNKGVAHDICNLVTLI